MGLCLAHLVRSPKACHPRGPVRAKGQYVGRIEAPDAETAIKAAIEQFGITDPQQRRLIAQPVE